MISGLGSPMHPEDLLDGKYELLGRLGDGHFGEVWRARHALTGRESAVKIMNMAHSTPDDAWTEATRLTRLESDYLVRVFGAGQTTDVAYIDMELATGGSAGAAAGNLGTSPRLATHWVGRVADGLQLCHDNGLLHRDVKPDNILLDAAGNALLGDFGATGLMDPLGQASIHGDIEIVAPEVFVTKRCTRYSDVYSLGVTLIALLGGQLPLRLKDYTSRAEFEEAVQAGLPDIRRTLPHVSFQLAKVIATAVNVDPAERYESASAFRAALNRLPALKRDVAAVSPHNPSASCWRALGRGNSRSIHVCAEPRESDVVVTTVYEESGTHLRRLCGAVPFKKHNAFLQRVFKSVA